ncbi:MAG: galactose mutarotase [Acidobacteriota bacterium]|nr:galactose mutarotase [Acidobacteriota bacterium]
MGFPIRTAFTLLAAVAAVTITTPRLRADAGPKIKKLPFGKLADGTPIQLYVLTNKNGVQAAITNFGARLVSLKVPDKNGKLADVILGYSSVEGYEKDTAYFGAIAGRYANRIAKGRFTLDGVTYKLPINNGVNSLHGGTKGFDKLVWQARELTKSANPAVELTLTSPNGDQGYPGTLHVRVIYTLTDQNALRIQYWATTDKPTVINLTNHAYFNLDGQGNGDILDTVLMINADEYTPTDKTQIPTGEIVSVKGTPFDFLKPTPIGARINENNPQLKIAGGYDHNWVVNRDHKTGLVLAARAYSPKTGRVLTVYTTEPGIQFYSGNFLDGTLVGKGGKAYKYRYGFTLETQHYPDSPNHPNFPSTVLKPGQVYRQTTVFKFSAR